MSAACHWLRRWRRVLGTVLLALVFGGVAINLRVRAKAAPYRYRTVAEVPARKTAIVLGASVLRRGRPSDTLRDRLDAAVELYRAGKVRKILLTGDSRAGYDEVSVMRRHVLAAGIPAADVFTDRAGLNTYDSMARARRVFAVDGAVAVTQRFHLDRAVYLARALGLDAVGLEADRRLYRDSAFNSVREWFARIKGFGEVALGLRPRVLGPVISINGDGRASWDRDRRPELRP